MDVSIGDLARKSGVKVPTIRYYESVGLIPEPARSAGNQRRYTKRDLERLGFIKHARDMGLSLGAIRDLMALADHPERACDDADRIARDHLADVRARIAQLRRLEAELVRMTDECNGGSIGDCRVLQALSDHSLCEGDH
ncbi:MAG: helix-turn-helix domain-containing protein [Pseudomonadota bacterium]